MARADPPPPPELDELDGDLAALLLLLEPGAALRRAARLVTAEAGLPVGFLAVPSGPDAVRIEHAHGTRTGALDGVVVPSGLGLGGKVAALRRPAAVADYCTNGSITHHFDAPVQAEGLRAMVAVPLQRGDDFYGVLYGAARAEGDLGDRPTRALESVAARTALALVVAERARHPAELAVSAERVRLSAALHDSVGALLFAIGAGARELAEAAGDLPELAARARAIEDRAGSAARALRRSLRALHSPPGELAVGVALHTDCLAFEQRTGVPARVVTLTDLPALPPPAADALLATAREALLNVEKHAGASGVVVTLAAADGGLAVAVTDDGRGLPAPAAPGSGDGTGIGLEAAAARVARLGGTLRLTANDGGGVTLRAWLPC